MLFHLHKKHFEWQSGASGDWEEIGAVLNPEKLGEPFYTYHIPIHTCIHRDEIEKWNFKKILENRDSRRALLPPSYQSLVLLHQKCATWKKSLKSWSKDVFSTQRARNDLLLIVDFCFIVSYCSCKKSSPGICSALPQFDCHHPQAPELLGGLEGHWQVVGFEVEQSDVGGLDLEGLEGRQQIAPPQIHLHQEHQGWELHPQWKEREEVWPRNPSFKVYQNQRMPTRLTHSEKFSSFAKSGQGQCSGGRLEVLKPVFIRNWITESRWVRVGGSSWVRTGWKADQPSAEINPNKLAAGTQLSCRASWLWNDKEEQIRTNHKLIGRVYVDITTVRGSGTAQ